MRILPDALCTPHEKLAERVGFEPTLGFPKHAFQACAFSRSATSPFFQFQISDCRFTGRVSLVHAGSFPGFHSAISIPQFAIMYGGEAGI
jgi:hypothetical protein